MRDFSTGSTLQTIPDNASIPLSAHQKTFNRLARQSTRLEQEIQDWEQTLTQVQQRVVQEMLPIQEQLQRLRIQFLLQLEESNQTVRLGKTARETLATVLWEEALELLQEGPTADPALQTVLERLSSEYAPKTILSGLHAWEDAEGNAPLEGESFMDFMERLANDLFASQTETIKAEWEKREADDSESMYGASEGDSAGVSAAQNAGKSRGSARQRAREAQQAAEVQKIHQSLQTIYRQLVRVAHPDRESDATLRVHKTVLMQRVNQAYAQKDLLQLLMLQQELGQMDTQAMGNWGEDTLRTYNQALKTHIAGLKATISGIQKQAAACMGKTPFWAGSHRAFVQDFETTLREMKGAVKGVQREIKALQSPSALKAWLTKRRQEIRWQEQMEQDMAWGEEWPPEF